MGIRVDNLECISGIDVPTDSVSNRCLTLYTYPCVDPTLKVTIMNGGMGRNYIEMYILPSPEQILKSLAFKNTSILWTYKY